MTTYLICSKKVWKSMFTDGFALPLDILQDFFSWFPELDFGESRQIKIMLDGFLYPVFVRNQKFSKEKYPDHAPIYQVRYSNNSDFAKALRKVFVTSSNYFLEEDGKMKERGERKVIKLPDELMETISIYRTDDPFVWEVVPILNSVTNQVKANIKASGYSEEDIERFIRYDENASIIEKLGLKRIRRLDYDICSQLKKLYSNRCQICGCQVGEPYGAEISEGHHIQPFSTSLNNDSSNIIILCPNHHRIIHKTHPEFKLREKSFVYQNGYAEKLKIDYHLGR